MRRGEIWRYEPVIVRAGEPTTRLIVSGDSINSNGSTAWLYTMKVVSTDPESLLAVPVGDQGWALASTIERPVRKRLVERLGTASPAEMEQVDSTLRAVFDL